MMKSNDLSNVLWDMKILRQHSYKEGLHNCQLTMLIIMSLHAMGIVCSIISHRARMLLQTSLLKREKVQSVKEIIKNKGFIIKEYLPPSTTGFSNVKFKEMRELKLNKTLSLGCNRDFFWESSFFFREHTRSNWSGFMIQYSAGNYPGKSNVIFLPIVDLSLSDPSCIFTTLEFVIDQAKSLNVETPVIIFDQPLGITVTETATAKSMSVVIILAGFHLMMS